jgi:alkylated DNA repair dioxygenase AlkB/23S rRNA G2445 N2-methylase RlmL
MTSSLLDADDYLVPLDTPCVYYDAGFISQEEADAFYEDLLKNTRWEKTAKINRWVALYNNSTQDQDYKYRDAPGENNIGFTPTILRIKEKAEAWYNSRNSTTGPDVVFNVCLLNYYEDGTQRIGWHSDREEIGRTTPIASISLGATRSFLIRGKENGVHDRACLSLQNGSLVVMENVCQEKYVHSVPKESTVTEGRINLTFRCKCENETTAGEEEHERRDNWLDTITDGAAPNSKAWSAITPTTNDTQDESLLLFGDDVQEHDVEDSHEIYYLVKTNLGAERYAAAEIEEMMRDGGSFEEWSIVSRPLGMDGFVACTAPSGVESDTRAPVQSMLLKLRSAHHVLRYHTHFSLEDCVTDEFPTPQLVDGETLYQYFKKQLVEKKVSISSLEELGKGSFRVSCDRIGGPHAFKAPTVEFEIGGAIAEYFPDIKPQMQDYDECIRADVVGNHVVVGTQLNVHDLSKGRHFIKFRNAVTLKTNLAFAMVRLANITPGDHVVDPFCGSGTLLLEALEVYSGGKLYCTGLDVSRRSADGARENALAEGHGDDVCKFACSDARGLRKHLQDDSVDAMISNLPWGVMTGSKMDLQTMYEVFLRTSWYVLKDGARIVMLVLRGLLVTRIVRKLGGRYRLLSVNVVRTTNNLPCIIVIEKLPHDEVTERIKGQLAYMNQYVSVNPEIYHAIHDEDIE